MSPPVQIGFRAGPTYIEEEEVSREENNNIFDTETIPRLIEFREEMKTKDPIAATVLDSYIQLYAMGMIDVTFDKVTGEPIAEIIRHTVPQFRIRAPSVTGEEETNKGLLDTIN